MTTNKNKTAKNGSKLSVNKNAKQVIKKNENIEICPQKSPQNACVEQNCAEEMEKTRKMAENLFAEIAKDKKIEQVAWDTKDIVKDRILALRNRYASRTILSAEEFKSALAEIENAIK